MSECLEFSSSMTGSTNSGLVQPQKDSLPLLGRSSPFDRYSTPESLSARHGRRQRPSGKMTLTPPNGQPIQLTPLWEHVVRTRRFPNEIDTRLTFLEISERLRDPEWEVRQHALRVLIDVLPTLNVDVVDKVMQPVVPELINNLGHPAPAVRKGALDALRVYLIHSRDREETIKKILQDGLNRSEARDPYQTNITTGVILSAPSLLFPSSNSPSPPSQLIKDTTIALASRLAQVAHQEAVLKSLMKIRDAIGPQDFENYLADYDNKLIRNIDILSKIYNVKPSKKTQKRLRDDIKNNEKYEDNDLNKKWDSDSDTSGIAEEEDEVNNTVMPAARVVLETEIKFNEETAITMTILEEKEDSEKEQDEESGTDVRNDLESNEVKDSSLDRRKTPRRVHFGGEIVKLRTPDSDETESVETAPKTRIPLPVSPATKMPRRPSSQPCSPRREKGKVKRASRSVSNSPKREVYTHNAELSPKKSILTRTSSPVFVVKPGEQVGRKKKGRQEDRDLRREGSGSGCKEENPLKFFENCKRGEEGGRKEEVRADERAGNVEDLVLGRLVEGLGDKGLVKDDERGGDRGIVVVEESGSWKESSEGDGESVKSWKKQVDSNKLNSDVVGSGKRKEGGFVKEDRVDGEGKVLEDCKEERGREKGLDSGTQMDASKLDKLGIDTRSDSHFRSEVDEKEESNSCSKMNRGKSGVKKDVEIIRKDESKVVQGLGGMKTEACGVVENEEDSVVKDCAVLDKRDDCDLRRGDGERVLCSDRDKKSVRVMERSRNLGVAEVEGKSGEQSWEELGLVDQEVLEDLHNKEDWRARVRGLERVASALRTSSALIAIEPRLGSLLHAVLGCERSCRVAAAGLAVAKVVVAGVSEEALKRRLPQLAWGLARQGGPSAAQLARIAMLRLRPVLLLEQLLQAQCLNARNAKTRENALQLLIFSLVTFPSTEFKVDTVANKVAKMVGDRRRRVRQAALDTLAVLAQIYEPEEVLTAGKRAAEGRHDGEAMISAIRARLARKSLPLVSADGLVVYGLQISPTVQIATGPDVDWIVAGSGSVSPGTGRTKGQIIATSSEKGRVTRNANTKNRESPWIERPNFVALGVGMHPKVDQPVAWQIVPTQNQESTSKTESRIPVLSTRDRVPASSGQGRVKHTNYGLASANSRRRTKDALESTNSLMGSREEKTSSYGAPHQRRKRYYPENSESRTSTTTQILDHSYDSSYNYYPVTGRTQTDIDDDYRGMVESTREEFSEMNSRSHQKFTEKERFLKKSETKLHGRSNSTESCQRSAPRNIRQQTVLIQDMYNSMARRDRTFKNEDSFRQLQTAPTPLTRIYNQEDFSQQMDESNDRNNLSRTRFYRRTKDAVVQKIDEVELISSDAQTNGHYPPIFNDAPCRRRLRSLSPSQLYRRQQFVRGAGSNELHAISMYDIDKAVNEEEYNERNKHHFLPEPTGYHVQTNSAEARFPVDNRERILSKSASSSSSDVSKSNRQQIIEEDVHDRQDFSDSRSSTPQSQDVDPAFDIITNQSSPSNRDTVDSFVIPLNENLEAAADATITSIEDDTSKDWSSEDDVKLKNKSQIQYVCSEQLEYLDENRIESEYDAFGEIVSDGRTSGRRRSVVSVLSSERILTSETLQAPGVLHSSCSKDFNEIEASPSRIIGSPEKTEALYSSRSPSRNSNDYASRSPSRRNSCGSPRRLSFSHENEELEESGEERVITSILCDDTKSVQSLNPSQSRRESKSESPTIIIASRPHSNEAPNYPDNNVDISTQLDEAENAHRGIDEYSVNEVPEDRESKDSASETNTEPAILKIETHPVDPVIPARKMPSRVPRGTGKFRANGNKGNSEKPEKSKPVIQQCFSQLESKDWEITMKGLKTLSQIAKQHPEYLDACAAGTIGRFLGRHIKNLRSQVARAACLAAGDVFSSQIRGIDQDIDDIAGPLLHRTADTNRFLRADSNAALDHMVQHLPPHKTIGIIVQRGASHQNAIVRAATARLLAEIVDRVGPEHTMILPKDVRDKLLNTGARLLIDGNLDARNHAKRMFRRLTRCDGFRRALTDAVPETTLRHIDKTLKSL